MGDDLGKVSTSEVIELDALILGGGIQGLWLLMKLRQQGYEALLLERRELGGEQTCHSHVFLHHGFMYNEGEEGLVQRLGDTREAWKMWLDSSRNMPLEAPSTYYGYQSLSDAQRKADLWETNGLPRVEPTEQVPDAFADGAIRYVLTSPEISLNGQSLVAEIARDLSRFMSRIEKVNRIELANARDRVDEVHVTFPAGRRLVIRPDALILAAGTGNQQLLDLAAGGDRNLSQTLGSRQQLRKAHMLVVQGEPDSLRILESAGVFPMLRGLFIVPRHQEGRSVWLISDNRGPPIAASDDWVMRDARQWLPEVILALRELAPQSFRHPERLKWGVYEAPKAEGRAMGGIPHEERVESYFGIKNLWAIWPTKLTLAPRAADELVQRFTAFRQTSFSRSRNFALDLWDQNRVDVTVAPERWTITPSLPWDEFRKCHCIPL